MNPVENKPRLATQAPRRTASTGRRHSSTRETLLRTIEAHEAPLSTRALVEATELHENTVRGHLEHLLADGYVTRAAAPSDGRGRPAWLWSARVDTAAAPYAALASTLAETLARTSAEPVADAREAGRRWGHGLAEDPGDEPQTDAPDPRGAVVDAMNAAGFAAHDTGSDLLLRRCPLIEAATKHPSIVCSVHLGMVEAVLERTGGGSAELKPFTAPGECTLRITS